MTTAQVALLEQMMGGRERMIAIYSDQVARCQRDVADAAVATNFGAGGKDGKRYNGMFYHQWVGKYEAAVKSYEELSA